MSQAHVPGDSIGEFEGAVEQLRTRLRDLGVEPGRPVPGHATLAKVTAVYKAFVQEVAAAATAASNATDSPGRQLELVGRCRGTALLIATYAGMKDAGWKMLRR